MRNPGETKRRLLEAATAEFAAYGIAGARVDRIAQIAECNKQSIYGYFGSKEGLFNAVLDAIVQQAVETLPITAHDLPGYAGNLFDWYSRHPEILRLISWMQLEGGDIRKMTAASTAASENKVAKVREAQRAGVVSSVMPAEHLLSLIMRLSTVQLDFCNLGAKDSAELRASMQEAVRRVVTS